MQIAHLLQEWWQQQTWLEITGVITGLMCVYLAAKNNIWNWPIAIISTGLYVFVYQHARLYADMLQYVYLCITSMYGWYNWNRHPKVENKTPVTLISKKEVATSAILILVITPVLGFLLTTFTKKLHYNPPAYPYLDSFCTACSFVAQFFLTRKVAENWLIWIFVDIIYVVIYYQKHLQITAFMFLILIVIAVFGYIDWKKEFKKQSIAPTV